MRYLLLIFVLCSSGCGLIKGPNTSDFLMFHPLEPTGLQVLSFTYTVLDSGPGDWRFTWQTDVYNYDKRLRSGIVYVTTKFYTHPGLRIDSAEVSVAGWETVHLSEAGLIPASETAYISGMHAEF